MSRSRTVVGVSAWVGAAVLIAACGGGNSEPPTATAPPTTASPTASPTAALPTPIATPSLEEEVAEAYLAHWDAYAAAVLHLDIALVEERAAGEELEAIRDEIESLRSDGVALRVVVEHDFQVVNAVESSAIVIDQFVNNSFYVDAETKEPTEGEGSGEVIRHTVHMEKVDGRWVVVRVTLEAGP